MTIRECRGEFIRRRFVNVLADWKNLRKKQGEPSSDAKFCELVGISRSALAKYKSKKAIPSDGAIKKVCEVFNMPVEFFSAVRALELLRQDVKRLQMNLDLLITEDYLKTFQAYQEWRGVNE